LDGAVGSQLPVTMLIVAVSPALSRKVTVDFSASVKRWKIESARTQKFDLDCRFYRLDAPSFQEKLALVFSASRERVGWNSRPCPKACAEYMVVETGISSRVVAIGDCGFLDQADDVIFS
jgi:hypothetical protein